MQSLQENVVTNEVVSVINNYQKSIGYHIFKRLIDIFGSLCGIILLSPVMLIAAAAIKIDSEGPIFFFARTCGD